MACEGELVTVKKKNPKPPHTRREEIVGVVKGKGKGKGKRYPIWTKPNG